MDTCLPKTLFTYVTASMVYFCENGPVRKRLLFLIRSEPFL